jgi:hypothetical protein
MVNRNKRFDFMVNRVLVFLSGFRYIVKAVWQSGKARGLPESHARFVL